MTTLTTLQNATIETATTERGLEFVAFDRYGKNGRLLGTGLRFVGSLSESEKSRPEIIANEIRWEGRAMIGSASRAVVRAATQAEINRWMGR